MFSTFIILYMFDFQYSFQIKAVEWVFKTIFQVRITMKTRSRQVNSNSKSNSFHCMINLPGNLSR